MSGSFQGFVINRNLVENPIDRNAINNLGVSPIADDISLFKNNKRNVSTLTVSNANINSTSDYISYTDRDVVFTNGTKIIFNGIVTFYVANSNGVDKFQLSSDGLLQNIVQISNSYAGTYTRSDEITFDNITNYAKRRRPALTNVTDDLRTNLVPFTANVRDEIAGFEYNLDNIKNIKNNSILSNQNFTTELDFQNKGHVVISDPDGFNVTGLTATSGPGIFIYNPIAGSKIRAFSDTQNVWKESVDTLWLETSSRKITTGVLTLKSNNVIIQQKAGSTQNLVINATSSTAVSNSVFTHKIKVLINNEEYFVCLSNTATVV